MNPPIRGIVVAGNTLEEAQEFYRAVATGQDVKALHDEEETFVVLSSAASDISMVNPLTGADDLIVGDGLTEQMEFLSSDSEAVNINYTICTAGCQAHVLADYAEMLKHCPACASVLPELDEEAIAALAGDDDEECEDCKVSAIASGKTLEEAVANYQAMVLGESDDTKTMKCGDVRVSIAGDHAFDVYKGCASTIVEHEPAYLESLSSSSEELDAHHFVCASSACGAHVVSSDDMPVFCPSCSSGLMEVSDLEESTAGDEDEDDDQNEANAGTESDDDEDGLTEANAAAINDLEREIEEALAASDDDESDEDDEDYDDEEEDDDSDEDEDDDSDDEEDDEDEDEEDEEEDDLDEDEDDDEALTLSVSSVVETPASRRARNLQEARASVQEEEQEETTVAVAASFLATASANAELSASKVEVAYNALASGNKWFAFYDGVPFAVATAASAEKHAQIFNTDVFGRAFKAQANEQGVQAAVENMGFVEIKPEIQVADYVKSEIDQQVELKTSEVAQAAAQAHAEYADRHAAAMALAATGITKNFFVGQTNPIAQQLIESLSAVGLDNASSLVNQAFAQNSDAYHKLLLAKASQILSYSLEAQNEIAQAVGGFNNVEATASTTPMQMGRPVAAQKVAPKQETVEATASVQPSADFNALLRGAVSGLGKR